MNSFQRLMIHIFRSQVRKYVHVYLDNIFIFSNTIEEHEKHIEIMLKILEENGFSLKRNKVQLYAEHLDCLGHDIDNDGIHVTSDKIDRILEWRELRDYNDVQRFVGLIQYIAHFLPEVAMYTGTLTGMTSTPFQWRPIHQQAFDSIKQLC